MLIIVKDMILSYDVDGCDVFCLFFLCFLFEEVLFVVFWWGWWWDECGWLFFWLFFVDVVFCLGFLVFFGFFGVDNVVFGMLIWGLNLFMILWGNRCCIKVLMFFNCCSLFVFMKDYVWLFVFVCFVWFIWWI